MLSNQKVRLSMAGICDQMMAVIDAHERETHDGHPCLGTRASTIAFFASKLGVRGAAWKDAETLLRQYDAEIAGQKCDEGLSP